jgi:hypothetical protein
MMQARRCSQYSHSTVSTEYSAYLFTEQMTKAGYVFGRGGPIGIDKPGKQPRKQADLAPRETGGADRYCMKLATESPLYTNEARTPE